MKAGFIYEKLGFTQDGDPIHDMGIGKFRLKEDWERIFSGPIKEYNEFIGNLVGKKLTGIFTSYNYRYVPDATTAFNTGDADPVTITIKSVRMYQGMNIIVESTNGHEFILDGEREYKIE